LLDAESHERSSAGSDRQVREFSAAWLVFFLILGVLHWFRHHNSSALAVYVAVALVVGVAGLLQPRIVKPVFTLAMAVSLPIGWVMTRVVLALLFYVLFAPVAWLFRLLGRDSLRLKKSSATTYWSPAPPPTDGHSSFRQSI
jgi:hypothetical protein